MEETGKTPERKKGRPRVYSGEGYAPGRELEARRRRRLAELEQAAADEAPRSASSGSRYARQGESAKRDAQQEPKRTSGWQEKLRLRRRRKLRIFFGCAGGVLAAAYLAVAVYFGFHFYDGTSVYGIDCSRKSVEEVKREVKDKLDEYVLEVQEREERTETISASEIGLQYVDNGGIDRMMKAQRSYIWPVMLLLDRAAGESVAFSYDQEQAKQHLGALQCMDSLQMTAPRDAFIAPTDTGFEVVSEVMGTTLDKEKTQQAVLGALDAGATKVSLDQEGCYVDPALYQDDKGLQSDAAAMSELARGRITYTFGEQTELVDAAKIQEWLVRLSDGSFVIDDVAVTNYVESLAAKYDTFGLPLDFYTSLGTTVTLSGGDYGWCIDQNATVVALLNALGEGYRGEMEPVYLYSAMSHENQGIGYTYVEICISQQRMWCYQDGNVIVDTPVVTGNPNKGNGTPSGGVWAIDAKKRDAILTGEGYTAPVDYWMPFNGDVGIHDMQQRAYFGGSIYLSNGSHGCVNTPYDQVEIIYNAVSIGTPVIVYE